MSVGLECPYCLSQLRHDDDTISCDCCNTLYHKECWIEGDGCCLRGCGNFKNSVEIEIAADNRDSLIISREEAEAAITYRKERFSNPCLRCGRHVPEGSLYCTNCTPEPEESQDVRNLGPMLIMLFVAALVLAWFFGILILPDIKTPTPSPSEVKTNIKR